MQARTSAMYVALYEYIQDAYRPCTRIIGIDMVLQKFACAVRHEAKRKARTTVALMVRPVYITFNEGYTASPKMGNIMTAIRRIRSLRGADFL